jgi:hypothetical protein
MEHTTEVFDHILDIFQPVTLNDMDGVKLMNRVDTKFVLNKNRLADLLQKAQAIYSVLEIDNQRITPYSSLYFDTPDLLMYTMHHNGKRNRYKVRMRVYENSQQTFLEVKHKNNKGRTNKKRVEINYNQFENREFCEVNFPFLKQYMPYNPEMLRPTLQNYFRRITLVDKNKTERITIDIGLKFRNIENDSVVEMDELVIIEIKQDGACKSEFRSILEQSRIFPSSLSKYCLGIVHVNQSVKSNFLKYKIRRINKIINREYVAN